MRVQEAHQRIDAAEAHLFKVQDLIESAFASLAAAEDGDAHAGDVVAVVDRIRPQLKSRSAETWSARRRCEASIGVIYEQEFRALDLAIAASQAVTRKFTDSDSTHVPAPVTYAMASLAARAHSTTHEIIALLRSAFVNGAQARWRTLHEVRVVASVLTLGNRHTAARFNHHRWIALARDWDHPLPDMVWRGPGPSPSVMRDRLVKRYGKPYAGPYGWASLVTTKHAGAKSPSWYHLENVAHLADGHRLRVKSAHHSVHADALGVLQLIDSSGSLHSGAMLQGVPDLAWQTVRTLRDTTDALLSLWARYDPGPGITLVREISDEILFQAEVMILDSESDRSSF